MIARPRLGALAAALLIPAACARPIPPVASRVLACAAVALYEGLARAR